MSEEPRGFYADPLSPIASTPQRSRRRQAPAPSPATPSRRDLSHDEVPLSPMHKPTAMPRKDESGAWSAALFSPVLKFFNGDGEEVDPPAEGVDTTGYYTETQAPHLSIPSGTAAEPASSSLMSPSASAGSGSGAGMGAAVAASAASLGRGVPVTSAPSISVPTVSTAVAPAPTPPPAVEDSGSDEGDYAYEFEEFNPYLFIKLLPEYSTVAPPRPRIVLPRKSRRAPHVSLVLDLDETLVHCSVDPIPDADLTFPVEFNGTNYMVYVRKRPYLDRFLEAIHKKFEVTIFTASQKVYACRLLDLLDPEKKYIQYRLYRDSCLNVDGNYLKDLTCLGRDLRSTVLVDNSPHAFGYQLDNGIPIESWFDDPRDTELLKLASFLDGLTTAPDVRPILRRRFRMKDLVENSSLEGFGPGPRSPGTL